MNKSTYQINASAVYAKTSASALATWTRDHLARLAAATLPLTASQIKGGAVRAALSPLQVEAISAHVRRAAADDYNDAVTCGIVRGDGLSVDLSPLLGHRVWAEAPLWVEGSLNPGHEWRIYADLRCPPQAS